jgi:cell division protein FtsB
LTSWLETAPAPLELRRPRPKTRRRRAKRPSLLGGVVSIAAFAVLLAGVVALNVAVLQLNLRLDKLARERADLHAANASLAAQLSGAAATPQVEALAQKRLGFVPAEQMTYVELDPGR